MTTRTAAPELPVEAISIPQAARMIGVSRAEGYRMVHRGELEAKRRGRRIVVPIEAVKQCIKNLPDAAA